MGVCVWDRDESMMQWVSQNITDCRNHVVESDYFHCEVVPFSKLSRTLVFMIEVQTIRFSEIEYQLIGVSCLYNLMSMRRHERFSKSGGVCLV